MTKCSRRYKLLFGFFKIRDKHNFSITNAFYTLEDPNIIDIVKTCQNCGAKDIFVADKSTLIELIEKFPNAFKAALRGYLQTWMR